MAKTAEEATLSTIHVGDRDFPIGAITIHQIFQLKNLIASIVLAARVARAKREESQTDDIILETSSKIDDLRAKFADSLGIDPEKIDEASFLKVLGETIQAKMLRASHESGYEGQMGVMIGILEVMTEYQILQMATLILDRYTHTRVTFEFVEKHFSLEWFLEALAITFETNNIANIIKNSQRLGEALSTQATLAAN